MLPVSQFFRKALCTLSMKDLSGNGYYSEVEAVEGKSVQYMKEKFWPFRNQLPAILWASLILLSSAIPGHYFPRAQFWWLAKIVHVIYFFLFSLFLYHALRNQRAFPILRRFSISITFFLTALYGATDEAHQLFVDGRHAALTDIAIDATSGALFFLCLWILTVVQTIRHEPKHAEYSSPGLPSTD